MQAIPFDTHRKRASIFGIHASSEIIMHFHLTILIYCGECAKSSDPIDFGYGLHIERFLLFRLGITTAIDLAIFNAIKDLPPGQCRE